MKKILITGGAGFIGTEVVKQLSDSGEYEITVLDAMTKQIHGECWKSSYLYKSIETKCHFIKTDIRDFKAVKNAVSDSEYIIHLASETGTGQSMYQINRYNEVNLMGTSNILQAISEAKKESRVRKIILSSSRSVYGEGKYVCPQCGIVHPGPRKKERMTVGDFGVYCEICNSRLALVPTTEDSKITPNSLYAFTKYAQERMLETMCPALGVDYTIFRFQNVYGIGQSLKNPYTGILSIFSSLLLENKPINIFEDGNESRDFINVIDVASTVIKSLETLESSMQIINLGSGNGVSVIEIAKFLKAIYKSNSQINVTGDFRMGDIAHNIADISKAEDILDFKQTISLERGLRDFSEWVLKQEKNDCDYEISLDEMENAGLFIRKI
ncbi:NAD-dependent epimerase/dehydratase family protein [Lacrimispora sp.]|uniref:NAD-dependent epimerase/dehydratase family protein n=1 Tax=Lacrimispora sp. TaxID=2719234 RepID=UPI00346051D3